MSPQEILEVSIVQIFPLLVPRTALIHLPEWHSGEIKKSIQHTLIEKGLNLDSLTKIVNLLGSGLKSA